METLSDASKLLKTLYAGGAVVHKMTIDPPNSAISLTIDMPNKAKKWRRILITRSRVNGTAVRMTKPDYISNGSWDIETVNRGLMTLLQSGVWPLDEEVGP